MKSQRTAVLAAALLAAAALLCQSCSHLRCGGAVRIVLENGPVRAGVVPKLGGRVISLQFAEGPNLLWVNPRPEDLMWKWRNFGGEKTWIGPQGDWKPMAGMEWPPPLFFDSAPHTVVTQTLTSVATLSAADAKWNLRVSRTVEVLADRVSVTSELVPARDPADVPRRRITNWSVAQFPPAPRVAVRLTGRRRIANGMAGARKLPEPERLPDDIVLFNFPASGTSGKCSFDADRFLIEVPGGYLLVSQHGAYPDSDGLDVPERAQLYFAARRDLPPRYEPYMEVEFVMPHPGSRQRIDYRFIPAPPGTMPDAVMPQFLSSL